MKNIKSVHKEEAALIKRPEFNQFKTVIIVAIFGQLFFSLNQLFDMPSHVALINSAIATLVVAGLMLSVIGEAKDYHPRFYIITLVLFLMLFIVQLTTFNYFFGILYPADFKGIHTIIDALYFTIGTISTAGTGEILPISQVAKFITTCEVVIGFALIVLVLVKEPLGLKMRQ